MNQTQKRSSTDKWLLVLAGITLVVSCGSIGRMLYLKRQATQGQYARKQPEPPDMAPEKQKARLQKANMLRDKWKSWALQHKSELKQMLGGDRKAQATVWAALPTVLEESGAITPVDVNEGNAHYSWQPLMKMELEPQSAALQNALKRYPSLKTGEPHIREVLQNDFTQYRDISLSQSRNSGAKTLKLWASGRVTETETVRNPRRSGQPSFREVSREISPPYDFLS